MKDVLKEVKLDLKKSKSMVSHYTKQMKAQEKLIAKLSMKKGKKRMGRKKKIVVE